MKQVRKHNYSRSEIQKKIIDMDAELRFLWNDAHQEEFEEMRERKIKQFWELFRTYRQQKRYLIALVTPKTEIKKQKQPSMHPFVVMITRFLGEV